MVKSGFKNHKQLLEKGIFSRIDEVEPLAEDVPQPDPEILNALEFSNEDFDYFINYDEGENC